MNWLIAAAVVLSGLWGIGWCFCKIAALAEPDEFDPLAWARGDATE